MVFGVRKEHGRLREWLTRGARDVPKNAKGKMTDTAMTTDNTDNILKDCNRADLLLSGSIEPLIEAYSGTVDVVVKANARAALGGCQ